MNVVVVGGGVAGIVAALDCAAAGAAVTLVEVRPRLGGAAYSVERDGIWLDNGQHVFLRCCTSYRELLAKLGSAELVELQERLEIAVLSPARPAATLRRSGARPPLHLARTLLRYPHLSLGERVSAGRAALALGRVGADDSRTFGSWLAEHGQSDRAIAALWDLIALPTLNLRAAEASLALGAFVFQEGLLKDAAAGDIGLHVAPLQQIIGDPAARALAEAGVTVHTRWPAQRVTTIGGRFAVVGGGSWLGADAVIVAVPHDRAAEMLPPAALRGAAWPGALRSSPIVNVHVVYDRRVLPHRFAAGVATPVQYVFDRTPAGWGQRQYIAVSLSAAREEMGMGTAALRERYLAALAQLLPAAASARVEHFSATKEHAATFRAVPGTAALRPPAATALPGLALAGAWTATGWPATLEGAARSGHAAAAAVLA
ncbi:MAG TPA: hydroxysqualene dehydroxylase HpnE [Solirubrobacteraceae bacterium]|jgi:squalene-associated FAD-dependent desaturase